MQGDQRRRTGRVHRQRRPLQAQRVRHPSRDDARRVAGEQEAADVRRDGAEGRRVVVADDPGEHAGAAAPQRARVDAGPLQRLPGDLQHQPLLRVGGQRLPGRQPEETGVEVTRVVEETAVSGVRGAGLVRVGVEQVRVPAPVGGERADPVPPVDQVGPEGVRSGHAAREAAGHRHDRDAIVGGDRLVTGRTDRDGGGGSGRSGLLRQVSGERRGVGVVEGERAGERQSTRVGQSLGEFERAQRVEAHVGERPVRRNVVTRATQYRGRLGANDVQPPLLLGVPHRSPPFRARHPPRLGDPPTEWRPSSIGGGDRHNIRPPGIPPRSPMVTVGTAGLSCGP